MKIKLLVVALAFGQVCGSALTIIPVFIGGEPPTNSIGSGNLTNIFAAACKVWELAIRDDYTYTINFGWGLGAEEWTSNQGGTPSRAIVSNISFNNDNNPNHFSWYLDPAPLVPLPLTNYTEQSVVLGTNSINASRYYEWATTNVQVDLFTTALHEIGHSLGLDFANTNFDGCVDGYVHITDPRPFPGTAVPLETSVVGGLAPLGVFPHIANVSQCTLMTAGGQVGKRILPSVLDIITVAQLDQFTNLNVDLVPVLQINPIFKKGKLTQVTLSWIQPLPGTYIVEQCNDLQTGSWAPVTPAPTQTVTGGGTYTVTMPVTANNAFFRLKKV